MATLDRYTIFNTLHRAGVPMRASAQLGGGIDAALWERNETAYTRYERPEHHTLSLYLDGGAGIVRRQGKRILRNAGPGSLCVMPAGMSTDWDVSGPVRMFHLYIPQPAFDAAVAEALDVDPASVCLRDDTYVRDATVETIIRSTIVPLDWNEPAERVAVGHASRMLIAYLVSRFSNRTAGTPPVRGGLPPVVVRRVREYVGAHLETALTIDDLATVAGLSPFHFARAFKHSTGEAPHRFVLRQRLERARTLVIEGGMPLAEVAAACGFSSQSHFTQRFRQFFGLPPKRFALAGPGAGLGTGSGPTLARP